MDRPKSLSYLIERFRKELKLNLDNQYPESDANLMIDFLYGGTFSYLYYSTIYEDWINE